jgi:DNA replication protein DnaC
MVPPTDADVLRIDAACKALKLPGAQRAWRALAQDATASHQALPTFLAALLEAELANRAENVLHQRLAQARFPAHKTLDGFDFAAQPSLEKHTVLTLARGDFLRTHDNVVLVGNTGTGKTHLAIALGLCALQAGYRVRFTTVMHLANDLLAASAEHRLTRLLTSWRRTDLVILDELGFIPLAREGANALFQFFADRYERSSVLITTNLEFSRWTEVFGDAHLTAALLDRLLHHAHILEHTGTSHRFRESAQRHQPTGAGR